MPRGNYAAARRKFVQALKREPHNPTILNNLWLLDSSHHALGRRAADENIEQLGVEAFRVA
jgi:Flp pilus assembly protein TadD